MGADRWAGRVLDLTTVDWVAAAFAAVPQLFCASGGTKTAITAGVFRDSRAGGFDRIFRVGEVYPSNDPAVTACPTAFV